MAATSAPISVKEKPTMPDSEIRQCPYCGEKNLGIQCQYCGALFGEETPQIPDSNSSVEAPLPIMEGQQLLAAEQTSPTSQSEPARTRSQNYLLRHWRGELSLPRSY